MSKVTLKNLADEQVREPETLTEQKLLGVAEETLAKDYNVFKQLHFMNNEIEDAYAEVESKHIFNETAKIYGKSLYTKEQLKVIAVAYNLRLLSPSRYNGKIPHNIVSGINAFCAKHEINLDGPASEDFYILGPEEHFTLNKWVKPVPVMNDPIFLLLHGVKNYLFGDILLLGERNQLVTVSLETL